MKIFIKNMYGPRSVSEVSRLLQECGLNPAILDYGKIEIAGTFSFSKYNLIKAVLSAEGFEVIPEKKTILAERIGQLIKKMVCRDECMSGKFSGHLRKEMLMSYPHLSAIFRKVKCMTIEQFIIQQKIERIKKLLLMEKWSISEIAWKLNYSSPGHLSNQFKKITGLAPAEFKKLKKSVPVTKNS